MPTRRLPPSLRAICLAAALAAALGGVAGVGQDEPAATDDVPGQIEDPREILAGYPRFVAEPRVPVLEESGYYPCTDCHDNEYQITNPKVRVLEGMHDDVELTHGAGRFWCLTCHHADDRDQLTSLEGQKISFDESYLLCGQCHFERQRDFFNGAHGKRLESWRGERTIAACTSCHDPHQPAIRPAAPYPPPRVRRGLEPSDRSHHRPLHPWEEATESAGEAPHGEEPDR